MRIERACPVDEAGDARGVSFVAGDGAVVVVDVALLSSKGSVGDHGEGLLLAFWFSSSLSCPFASVATAFCRVSVSCLVERPFLSLLDDTSRCFLLCPVCYGIT